MELARLDQRVSLRDSKNPEGILTLRAATWTALLLGIHGARTG